MIYILMPIIFIIAIFCIAFEDKIHVNKAAVAILSAIILWAMLFIDAASILGSGMSAEFNHFLKVVPELAKMPPSEQYSKFLSEYAILERLGDVSTTIFFVMCSMIIVEVVDSHGGFRVITNRIHTQNKRRFLVIICLLTFFMSALLDNLATAIVIMAILNKFIPKRRERWVFACMVIIAANAGGAWSPIGDVTTILLWTGGNLTPVHQITSLFLPSVVCMIVPLFFATRFFKKEDKWAGTHPIHRENNLIPQVQDKSRIVILIIGMMSLALVPVFNELTGLPPFMGIMGGLAVLWVYTDLIYKKNTLAETGNKMSLVNSFSKLDMPTIMFFFGILMSVAALNTAGQLQEASGIMNNAVGSPKIIAIILGLVSSFLDNVALVSGAMGMYSIESGANLTPYLQSFAVDGDFWTFLAYCCVTGGSILIIGSATGVAVMGAEKISFRYYLKNFTLLALSGYIAGALTYMAIS